MEDMKIIELFFKRNPDAISETDRSYGRKLHILANNILRCNEDAEESVSDTYLKAWETIPPKRPAHFFAYLGTICRHFAFGKLDWNNAEKRKAEVIALTEEMQLCIPDDSQDRKLAARELGRAINTFLETLTVESRLIFLRRYWYCDTVAEIAQRYAISESKVKTRLHRTRTQFRAFLEKEGITV